MAKPELFDGSRDRVEPFIRSLVIYFTGRSEIPNEKKILFALSYMQTGRASGWADAQSKKIEKGEVVADFTGFIRQIRDRFRDPDLAATARSSIAQIRQRGRDIEDFLIEFEKYQEDCGYDEVTLMDIFKRGIDQYLVDRAYQMESLP